MRRFVGVIWLGFGCGRIGYDAADASGAPGVDVPRIDAVDVQARCALSSGLVAYWPFDENGGSLAADVSTSNHDATLSGTTAWGEGAIGSALVFDGPDDFAFFPATPALGFAGGTGSFSVSYWLAPLSITSATMIRPLEIANCAGVGYVFVALENDGAVRLGIYDHLGNTGGFASPAGVIQVGRWTHVAHVADRGAVLGQTYLDGLPTGAPVSLAALAGLVDCSAAGSPTFGGWSQTFNYQGSIDDVRIFDRVLTPGEIQDLALLTASDCPW